MSRIKIFEISVFADNWGLVNGCFISLRPKPHQPQRHTIAIPQHLDAVVKTAVAHEAFSRCSSRNNTPWTRLARHPLRPPCLAASWPQSWTVSGSGRDMSFQIRGPSWELLQSQDEWGGRFVTWGTKKILKMVLPYCKSINNHPNLYFNSKYGQNDYNYFINNMLKFISVINTSNNFCCFWKMLALFMINCLFLRTNL